MPEKKRMASSIRRRTVLKTLGISTAGTLGTGYLSRNAGATAGGSVPPRPQEEDCPIATFRTYSTAPASKFERLQEDFKDQLDDAELNYWASQANIIGLEAFQTIVELQYGETGGTVEEFLDTLTASTRVIAQANDDAFYQTLHKYSLAAQSAYSLVHSPQSTVEEYANLLGKAVELRNERDLDSIAAALKLAYRTSSGELEDDILNMAVEISELPTDDAIRGLQVNAQQQLAFKVYLESQLPILEELASIARRRENGESTLSEINGYFIYQQEYWSALMRFANQIQHLQEVGTSKSMFFWLARTVNNWLGQNLSESTDQAISSGQQEYERFVRDHIQCREDLEACDVTIKWAEKPKEMSEEWIDEPVDVGSGSHSLMITGDAPVTYTLSVDGNLKPDTEGGAFSGEKGDRPTEKGDGSLTVRDTTGPHPSNADGVTYYGDRFLFFGSIAEFAVTPRRSSFDVNYYIDERNVTEDDVRNFSDASQMHTFMLTANGPTEYTLTVDGFLEPDIEGGSFSGEDSDAPTQQSDGSLTASDTTGPHPSNADGITYYGDRFLFSGTLTGLKLTVEDSGADTNVYLDEEQVTKGSL